MSDIKELREKYKSLYGKLPAPAWKEDKLQEMIDNFDGEVLKVDELPDDYIKIDPNETYVFKLVEYSDANKYFPTEMNTFDEKEGRIRKIRCSALEDSPYVDEQTAEAKRDSIDIFFVRGEYRVRGVEANRIKYLLASDLISGKKQHCPENRAIAGTIQLEDKGLITKAKLVAEENEFKAKQLVRTSSQEDLRTFLRSVYSVGVDALGDDEVLLEANIKAKQDAGLWLRDFENPIHKYKASVQKLFGMGELSDDDGVVKWKKTGAVVLHYDEKGERSDDVLAKFLLQDTQEAKDFKKVMDTKLNR